MTGTPDLGKRLRPESAGHTRHRPIGVLAGAALAVGLLALAAAVAPKAMEPAVVRVVFLIAAPALPAFLALRAVDLLARTVLAATITVVVNAVVAEAMLLTGTWSLTGGVLAVALAGVALAVVGHLWSPAAPSPLDSGTRC